ncbi:nuclear mRNA export, poly(A)+RNA binding protein [Exophiala xenobiotica]|nr:nuclear mRNA export, poly(A)+RNA binding protein [Exophiala xenobiotica]KAK5231059.1 nuclear mRNA export, poly(A)+RNA binding protein [Exophiala xenobiotica]KAK5299573.1 nuclear mRNA export, poly(A)+RNA binding protein [Exophiala xenobiotica]KAK5499588.1 nuclear mRNA export, poly(A)+RNA binding protein [Exophiala xenobiotica]
MATSQLAVKGWTTSKISTTSEDQGLEALLAFLGRKSSRQILSYKLAGRSVLLITVNEADKSRFTHLNGFSFAGANLVVEDARPPRNVPQSQPFQTQNQPFGARVSQPPRNQFQNGSSQPPSGPRGQFPPQTSQPPRGPGRNLPPLSANTRDTRRPNEPVTSGVENVLITLIHNRYNAADKHLILNTLNSDPELLNAGLLSDPNKLYKAIFVLCENKIWETLPKRKEAVLSVSLRDNSMKSIYDTLPLANAFPHIQNLDLANNALEDLEALKFRKNQFSNLEHIILTGNPVAAKPDTLSTLLKLYPNLKFYNNEPVQNAAAVQQQQSFGGGAVQPIQAQPQAGPEPTRVHPEFPPGSTFGIATPEKPADVLLKEQMGLQFSFETKLKMQWVENCLTANNWDYQTAMANFAQLKAQGQIPADAYIEGV